MLEHQSTFERIPNFMTFCGENYVMFFIQNVFHSNGSISSSVSMLVAFELQTVRKKIGENIGDMRYVITNACVFFFL